MPRNPSNVGSFRLFLALMVVVWHTSRVAPIKGAFATQTSYGFVAVCVFFMLSGYIITRAARTFYRGRAFSFIANRFVRLYPQYLLALAIAGMVLILPSYGAPLGSGALSLSNFAKNIFSLMPFALLLGDRVDWISIVWALRVEFSFYFCVCTGLWLAARFPRLDRGSVMLACFLGLALFVAATMHDGLAIIRGLFIPLFVGGVAFAFLGDSAGSSRACWTGLAIVSVALGVLQLLLFPEGTGPQRDFHEAIRGGYWMAAILFLFLLTAGSRARFDTTFDRRAGELSYLVYLVHQPIVMLLEKQQIYTIWNLLFVPAATLAAAMLLARVTEPPLYRLRHRLRSGARG